MRDQLSARGPAETHFGPSLVLDRTVALINAIGPPAPTALVDAGDPAAMRAAAERVFHEHGEPEFTVGADELPPLIRVVEQLFTVCAAPTDDAAAAAINVIFDTYAQRPRLTAHDGTRWHLHLDSDDDAPLHEWVATSAALALAVMLAESGREGWGICRAEGCGRVFLRSGANRRRSACSDRCATRARVRDHRRRQQAPNR